MYRQVVEQKGHFYVCGDCTMAECVYQKLKSIVQEHGRLSDQEVENFMLQMRVCVSLTAVERAYQKWQNYEHL